MPRGKGQGAEQSAAGAVLWRVGAYVRLSKEDGNNESESVINQKKILMEYLESSFEGAYALADFYIDDGLTGTDDTRAEFMRMISDIERGGVNCVLCKTLARAFRNYSDQGYYLEAYFPLKKVRFICVGDPKIDTHTHPEALTGLEVPITGLMNDRFAGKTSSDVRRTFNTKRRRGEFIGAFPPYGYLKDPGDKNHLIPDPEIVPIKREIRDWLLRDGMSLAGAARRLNELGVPNPTAYKRGKGWLYTHPYAAQNDGLWSGTSVRRVMLDKVNLGHMAQGKQRVLSYKVHARESVPPADWFFVENTHARTFTQQEYDALERALRRDTRAPNGSAAPHLFSGFLRCADCGAAMHRKPAKGLVYYVCRTHAEKSAVRCSKHSLRCDLIEAAVLAAIRAEIALCGPVGDLIERALRAPSANSQAGRIEKWIEDNRRELEKACAVTDGLYADWKTGAITEADYARMKARFQQRTERAREALARLETEKSRLAAAGDAGGPRLRAFAAERNLPALDRCALLELVETIRVHEGKAITIVFRFRDGKEA